MSTPVLILVNKPAVGIDVPVSTQPEFERRDPGEPQLSVLDLGTTRGDGVFETVMVSEGRAPALAAHLDRFRASALLLDLPEPDREVWGRAVEAAIAAAEAEAEVETDTAGLGVLAVKLVLTRGIEGSGRPTGWVLAQLARDFTAVRREGVRVVTLDRGYRHDVGRTSPWLLQGAKTLSYAINTAALREAARRGADEVVFTSSDGFVLEAPTASVLLREGNRFSTPSAEVGILPGTTQRRAFEFLRSRGHDADAVRLRASDLHRADAVWLVSAVRQAVPVTELDGRALEVDHALTTDLNAYLSARQAS
ncbi:aminodeoxychorismate lyase [Herbiconiux sp. CPCC 203407]|uniref:Aminodeoxychorismate lyase n=1 Tax=Herbiconiux oxytropis TaxID=2970915 RepID=A0AA41XE14_9MICO|nr:aminodeoxychorismate lyase [Herbiconiux oxytropis]MCS5721289.1 aminodeoxychorismate lyase [Herbiconiux oxytropis]MCS5726272.1 aminodeoxychorismate lyase [Herbiconiux oxytropis]